MKIILILYTDGRPDHQVTYICLVNLKCIIIKVKFGFNNYYKTLPAGYSQNIIFYDDYPKQIKDMNELLNDTKQICVKFLWLGTRTNS